VLFPSGVLASEWRTPEFSSSETFNRDPSFQPWRAIASNLTPNHLKA
jgi:hypothetical protein